MTDSIDEGTAIVDTNIVIYAYDPEDARKHQAAKSLLASLSGRGRLIFSAQVFNEFSSLTMKPRRAHPLSPLEVVEILRELAAIAEVVSITPAMTFLALDAMPRHGFSFWDALIWAAAKENGVATVYTEDFQHGRDVEGVRIVNPFLSTP
ncbi:MAG: hypothetical protein JWN86_3746 [Planctomycetota bacterium]|nr:hypothetical protein [Planctomycetota bacterium]